MAFFHQSIPQNDFTSLFRLLDDYDDHRATRTGTGASERSQTSLRTFSPRFDVHEEKDAYHLNGELPGIEQNDIHLDFVDAQTITVRGRVERNYSTSSNNGNEQSQGKGGNSSHKATVEDEPEQGGDHQKQVSTTTGAEKKVGKHHHHQGLKFWASERSVGEFTRSFTFPTNVDQDKVKASLKNGILTVVVPKAQAPQAKRIQIE